MEYLVLAEKFLFAGAIVLLFIKKGPLQLKYSSILMAVTCITLFYLTSSVLFTGKAYQTVFLLPLVNYNMELYMDALGAFFMVLAGGSLLVGLIWASVKKFAESKLDLFLTMIFSFFIFLALGLNDIFYTLLSVICGYGALYAVKRRGNSNLISVLKLVMYQIIAYFILRAVYVWGIPPLRLIFAGYIPVIVAVIYALLAKQQSYDVKNIGVMGIGLCTGLVCLKYGNLYVAGFALTGSILLIINYVFCKNIEIMTNLQNDDLEGLVSKNHFLALCEITRYASMENFFFTGGFIGQLLIYISLIFGIAAGNIFYKLFFGILFIMLLAAQIFGIYNIVKRVKTIFAKQKIDSKIILEKLTASMAAAFLLLILVIGLLPHKCSIFAFSPISIFLGGQNSIGIISSIINIMQITSNVLLCTAAAILAGFGIKSLIKLLSDAK